jgi:hypothetical protein
VLIKTDDIPRRVPESRGNLWRVHADRLHDLTAIRDHRINRRSHAVNHYVNQKAGLCGGRVADHPAATHFAGAAKYFFVSLGSTGSTSDEVWCFQFVVVGPAALHALEGIGSVETIPIRA